MESIIQALKAQYAFDKDIWFVLVRSTKWSHVELDSSNGSYSGNAAESVSIIHQMN